MAAPIPIGLGWTVNSFAVEFDQVLVWNAVSPVTNWSGRRGGYKLDCTDAESSGYILDVWFNLGDAEAGDDYVQYSPPPFDWENAALEEVQAFTWPTPPPSGEPEPVLPQNRNRLEGDSNRRRQG
jgi:hypothetical protein